MCSLLKIFFIFSVEVVVKILKINKEAEVAVIMQVQKEVHAFFKLSFRTQFIVYYFCLPQQ